MSRKFKADLNERVLFLEEGLQRKDDGEKEGISMSRAVLAPLFAPLLSARSAFFFLRRPLKRATERVHAASVISCSAGD